jgi:YesN/AraC family two-component response regulator
MIDSLICPEVKEQNRMTILSAIDLSRCYGGRYVFYSTIGFIYFASPIIRGGAHRMTAIAGPVLLSSHTEFIDLDVAPKQSRHFNREKLLEVLRAVPVIDTARANALSEQLFVNSVQLSNNNGEPVAHSDGYESFLSYYLYKQKKGVDTAYGAIERELVMMLSEFDEDVAKALLDELICHIMFHTSQSLSMLKKRVLDFVFQMACVPEHEEGDYLHSMHSESDYFTVIDELESLAEIVIWLNGFIDHFFGSYFRMRATKHTELLSSIIDYMKLNYRERLTLEEVAKRFFISAPYLSKIFKDETDFGFNRLLNTIRIDKSKDMLVRSEASVSEIASNIGYEDQSYFTKVFKRHTGTTPKEYRLIMRAQKNRGESPPENVAYLLGKARQKGGGYDGRKRRTADKQKKGEAAFLHKKQPESLG